MDILFVFANSAEAYMDIEREQRTLQNLTKSEGHSLHVLPAAEIADLQEALSANRKDRSFDILHFSGHATEEKGLHLRGAGRQQAFLSIDHLKALLRDSGIRLVVLNACSSESLALSLSEVVPSVIGTTRKVRDVVARQFTRLFYSALKENATVVEALDAALKEQRTSVIPAYIHAVSSAQ
jgi:CHAT domain-containing protein